MTGRSAHAGIAPEQGRNALVGACQIVLGLQALAQSSRPGIRVNVGTIRSGDALNVIPAEANLGSNSGPERKRISKRWPSRAQAAIAGIAQAYDLQHEIELVGEAADWANPPEVAGWAGLVAEAVGVFPTRLTDFNFGASEDATLMLRAVAAQGGFGGYFVLGSDLASRTTRRTSISTRMSCGRALLS